MGIGLIDFQGLWEGRKTVSPFSGLSINRHFLSLLHQLQPSGSGLSRSLRPVLLELHRADVVQRRVHACSVIPEQPCDGFIFGLTDGLKLLAVQSLHLQRSEQRLGTSVVPAVAFAAHRGQNAVPLE